MKIQEALIKASSFKELRPIVEKAEADISFWGIRSITVMEYEGRYPLDAMAGRVRELVKMRKELSAEEAERVMVIKEKIDQFYKETDSKIKEKNIKKPSCR